MHAHAIPAPVGNARRWVRPHDGVILKDLLKFLVALLLYGGLAPLLGSLLATRRSWQRALFGFMLFMPSLQPGKVMFMIHSIETYRGHTKGFEVSFIEVLAVALIFAVVRGPREGRQLSLPAGTGLYLAWSFTALLSFFTAWEPLYVLMAFSRFAKGALIFVAAALFLRDEKDLRAAITGLALSLVVHGILCLKMRYVVGYFQIKGWFEHQNPMSMWAYMSACVVFAAAMHKQVKGLLQLLCLGAFGAAGLCVLLSVSRAALAAYAAGAGIILVMAWLRGPGLRTAGMSLLGALGALLVALFAMDSLNSRLEEVKSSKENHTEDLRDILNRQSAAMLKDHPLLGIGWNNFGIANSRPHGAKYSEILENWDQERGFTIYEDNYLMNPLTESLYWLLLAENGYAGFFWFLIFELVTLRTGLRAFCQDSRSFQGYVAFGILVALLICYPHGMVERILTQTKNLAHWLMLTGMLAGMVMNRRRL